MRPSWRANTLSTTPVLAALRAQGCLSSAPPPHLSQALGSLPSTSCTSSALLVTIRAFTKRPLGWLSLLCQRPGCTLSPTRGSSAVDFAASLPAADIPGHSSGSSGPALSRTSMRATWAGNRTLHTRRAQALRALLPRPALRSPARGVVLACGLSAEPRAPAWPRSEGTQATPGVLSLTPGPTFWHALSGQQFLPTSSYASTLFAALGGTALAPLSSTPALSPGFPWAHARLILFLLQHFVGLLHLRRTAPVPASRGAPQGLPSAPPLLYPGPGVLPGMHWGLRAPCGSARGWRTARLSGGGAEGSSPRFRDSPPRPPQPC